MKFKDSTLQETIQDIKSNPQYCSAEEYIYWTAKTTPYRGRRVARIMQDYFDKNMKIVDVGSSQGLTIGYLAQVFPNIEGFDVDQMAIKTAKKRLKRLKVNAKLSAYNGHRLPLKDNCAEGMISTEVFEHVDNTDLFIKELHRVLKPGKTLIISTPNKLYPIECEFHLPFLSYLPKKLANLYVKLSKKGKSYDGVNLATYNTFKNTLSKYFSTEDITFHIIKNYDKYYLNKERGKIVPIIAGLLKILDRLDKTAFFDISKLMKLGLTNISAGWFFVCIKKKQRI